MRLYLQIGEHIATKTEKEGWGKSTVENLANYLAQKDPTLQGFTARNLWANENLLRGICALSKTDNTVVRNSVVSPFTYTHTR